MQNQELKDVQKDYFLFFFFLKKRYLIIEHIKVSVGVVRGGSFEYNGPRWVKGNFVSVHFLTSNFTKMKSCENILQDSPVFSRTPQNSAQILLISAVFKSSFLLPLKEKLEKIVQKDIFPPPPKQNFYMPPPPLLTIPQCFGCFE